MVDENTSDAGSVTGSVDDIEENEDNLDVRNEEFHTRTGSAIMFPAAGLSVDDVVSMVAGHCLRYRASNEARKSIMELLRICAGPAFRNINISNHRFAKEIDPPDNIITYHYYCTNCYSKLYSTTKKHFDANQILCEFCNHKHNISLSSTNMFLSIDLRYQLDLLMQDKNVQNALIEKINARRVTQESRDISDISDGELYRELIMDYPTSLTCNINTDGAPLFHKSKRSFWPLQLIFNDLPPTMRFKYVLTVGIMIVEHEPTPQLMNTYITEFIKQINQLREDGVDLGITVDNVRTSYTPTVLCCSMDSVARPVVQNRIQYNGYFGCSYCYHPGLYISAMRYPFKYQESELRTHKTHLYDTQVSAKTGLQSRGVKGDSVLASLSNFDMVWGFPLDCMHTVILGVTKHVWDLFTKILSRDARKIINERLRRIQPPRDLRKLPQSMTNYSNFKAKDWKSWLLYYSIPVCIDLVPKKNLEHYVLFVKSMYILQKTSISHSELDQCEVDLLKFVADFENLYGTTAMRYNVHSILHCVQSVRKSGPLWATSAFPYESNIFVLKQLVNGPKGVEQQMAKKSLQVMSYRVGVATNSLSNNVKIYCDKLFGGNRSTVNVEVTEGVTFFGSGKYFADACTAGGLKYEKCVYNGQLYQIKNYTRSKKWNNSIIQLKSKKIAQILEIISFPDTGCYFNVSELPLEKVILGEIEIPHMWKIRSLTTSNQFLVSIVEVASKMVLVDIGEQMYVCSMPNVFEAD
ncbi:uncharacterized protein LOC112466052 [Temnothorax curvispinosus]|uniref:Uncharacterized protein LOC112466052 n=1 Tax=Temnothorax curvispinosus TaxID=300111 RepID=A0A6J1R9T3_9HYME|nr:uncharacterized protein LOC112466052 [Temnothorax curvispinosus]